MQNEAVPPRDFTMGDEKHFGLLQRYEMCPEIFLADFSREGMHTLLRNGPGSGVRTLHYNSAISCYRNNVGTEE